MYTRVFWIDQFANSASVGIMARPRGNEWLEDEVRHLKASGVNTLISLLERNEYMELGLEEEELLCGKNEISFINYPIKDRSLPADQRTFHELILDIRNRLDLGEKVVIHCRMGIGRSSIVAAAVLLSKELNVDELLEKISAKRGLIVPDTQEQVVWLRSWYQVHVD